MDVFSPYLTYISKLFSSNNTFSLPEHDIQSSPPSSVSPFSTSESKQKTIELVIVNDPARTAQLGEDDVEVSTLQLYNIVQSLFDLTNFGGFHIRIQIVAVLSLTDDDSTSSIHRIPRSVLSSDPISPHDLLDEMSSWIGTFVNPPFSFLSFFSFKKKSSMSNFPWLKDFDHLQLLSGRVWDVSTVKKDVQDKHVSSGADSVEGLAFVRGMCQSRFSVSIAKAPGVDLKHGSSHLISLRYQAQIIAHELGHSLGASHDGFENRCPESGYIMQASAISTGRPLAIGWSSCSIEAMSEFLHHPDSRCLNIKNVPVTSLCGNGIIDDGEECDSGSPNGTDCCSSTCKLTPGSECDDRNGRCCQNCLLKKKGDVCRPLSTLFEKTPCDVLDLCDGITPACPDIWKPEGVECISGTAASKKGSTGICESGVCFSRETICKRMGMDYKPECDPDADCLIHCYDSSLSVYPLEHANSDQSEYEVVHFIKKRITNFLMPFFQNNNGNDHFKREKCITFALSLPAAASKSEDLNIQKSLHFQPYIKYAIFSEPSSPLVLPNGISCVNPSLSAQGMCYNGACKSKADYELELSNDRISSTNPLAVKSGSSRFQAFFSWSCVAAVAMYLNLAFL